MTPDPWSASSIFKLVGDVAALVGNVFTITASAIAIYVFLTKRKEIAAAFQLLLNYSYRTTLAELERKLERLNEYNASELADLSEIRNILHEIAGQIKGNSRLRDVTPDLAARIESLASGKQLTEPRKRSLVSEVREVLKNLTVVSLEQQIGE